MDWNKIVLLLHKVGILRSGIKSYRYTSGKDMPAEALLDDVVDPDKDIIFDFDKHKKR